MNAALTHLSPCEDVGASADDLYYWDEEQQRWIWTELHLRQFIENAEAPIHFVEIDPDAPTIICYVTNWEALL